MKNLSLKICLVIAALFGSVGSGFALPTCPSDPSVSWHNCFGIHTFAGGNKYTGEWRNNKKNGQGTFTFANGDKYVGEYKDDKRTGQGTLNFASGNKYVGEFKDGNINGQGTKTWGPNTEWAGDKYVGEWKDGNLNGQGTYYHASGEKYVGEYRDGKKQGQGTFTWGPNSGGMKDKYVGEWKDGNLNGQGIKTYANGTVKEGIWKDGEFQYAKKLSPTVPVAKTPTQDDEIISASSGSG